ncbi:MAG: D-alanyl-D-alanine carboxypeptidase [Blautia sp.]|nr:D-alanyl-D-alanine carboxypeptidase [Blautia sp.]
MFLEIVVVLTLVVIIGWDKGIGEWMESFTSPVVRELDVTGINSSHAVLMRAKGGKVLGEMNARERIYPASLTKMMTAILALEKLDPEDTITLTNEMTAALAGRDATQAGFQPGETVRVIDLIYGALLPSGAECCIALADTISGTEEQFAELMNQKARRIGMEDTNFRDSTGLHDPDHYSTAYDMALLLKYCMRNDTFREIIESPWHSTPATNVHPDGITFYSTMLKNLPDPYVTGGKILGGKTGFTNDAGLCLASYAEIGEREYILVTAGAPGTTGEPLHVHDAVTIFTRLGEAWQALAG